MKIQEIEMMFNEAVKMPHGLERARLMLAAQRAAMKSRARRAARIRDFAHLAAVCEVENCKDIAVRSELGRIRAESQFLYNGLRRS